MKALLMASLLIVSASALAMPKVGDSALYRIQTQGMTFTQKIELVSYDASDDTFVQKETTTHQGQSQVEVNNVAASDLINDQTADLMLQYCQSQMGGTLQNISVTAGTFATCSVYDPASQSQVWMGKVPFGMVKIQGSQVAGELIEFKHGK